MQNFQLDAYFLTDNSKNFLYVEGSAAWLYDSPQFTSTRYEADKRFDWIPVYQQSILLYTDPISRQKLIMPFLYPMITTDRRL